MEGPAAPSAAELRRMPPPVAHRCDDDFMEARRNGVFGDRILYVDATAEYGSLEGWGLHLFNSMAARVRAALSSLLEEDRSLVRPGDPVPEGPHFVYETAPSIFHARTGQGPLFIAWDTNLVIDYFKFGRRLWEGGGLPDAQDENYGSELEGLQLLIALWTLRDIRFVILPPTIDDAKKRLSPERRADRLRAFNEVALSLRLVSSEPPHSDLPSRDGLLVLPTARAADKVVSAVQMVPRGDRRDAGGGHSRPGSGGGRVR
jgi:hypothetical protein